MHTAVPQLLPIEPEAVGSPRWEWRTFRRQGLMRLVAAHVASSSEAFTTETYVLSTRSPGSVRIRNHTLVVRELLEATVEGIERWQAVLVARFPLSPAVLRRVFATWHLKLPTELTACSSEAEFRELAVREPALKVVPVEKRKRCFEFRHCRGEFAELAVRGERWETIALKDDEVAIVRIAVEALGLERVQAVSYPEALARICGSSAPAARESRRP